LNFLFLPGFPGFAWRLVEAHDFGEEDRGQPAGAFTGHGRTCGSPALRTRPR